MVDVIINNRRIEISIANLVSYILSLSLLILLLSFTLPALSSPPPLNPNPAINQTLWIHITAINFWVACLIGLIPSIRTYFENPLPQEVLPHFESDKQLSFDRDFYLARSDSMDRLIHYLRSGVSILLAIVTAAILWLLNLTTPLPPIEEALLNGSVGLAFFAVISLLISFGETSVREYGTTLEEDLIPHSQTDSQYLAQLREMLLNKRRINRQMKKSIGIGLLLFITVPILKIIDPVLSAIPTVPSDPVVSFLAFVSFMLMSSLFVLTGIIIVGNLGIRIISEEEADNP